MIVRIFTGEAWASAIEYGDFDVDQVPRIGEALAFGGGRGWDVARVLDVAHRLADGDSADVALLLAPMRQSRRGYEILPMALLDEGDAGEEAAPPASSKGPWG